MPSESHFRLLRELIALNCTHTHRDGNNVSRSLTPQVILSILLRILAGTSYMDVSWSYGLSVSSFYAVFAEMLSVLYITLSNIFFPGTEEQCM